MRDLQILRTRTRESRRERMSERVGFRFELEVEGREGVKEKAEE
jgi:hypothetical protein